jgi:uncharacterized protein (DUF1800 family)
MTWTPHQQPWDRTHAAHLFRRVAFGANATELERALADGPAKTIYRLLKPAADVAAFNREMDACETLSLPELRGWWLRRMMLTPHPLLEKMTLFWHGWFGVGHNRVNHAGFMRDHIRALRAHALGKLDALLGAIVHDPAVFLAAGGANNPKALPNEYFARQLLARYTVGTGQFSPRDVTDTARAFTGYHVRGGKWRDVPTDHDAGPKTIFGQTGTWTPADFARLAAKQPALARRVVRALYRQFISEEQEPSNDVIEPLARSFAADLDIGKLVATMLRSQIFFASPAQRVKSPVELAVGICRTLGVTVPTLPLGAELAELGQNLYQPPTLKGWPGGRAWINHATIVGRTKLATRLVGNKKFPADPASPEFQLA